MGFSGHRPEIRDHWLGGDHVRPWVSRSPSRSLAARPSRRGRACSVAGGAGRRRRAPQLLCIDASTRWRSPLGAGRGVLPARPGPEYGAGAAPRCPQLLSERRRFSASRRRGLRSASLRPSVPPGVDTALLSRRDSSGLHRSTVLAFSATSPRTKGIYPWGGWRRDVRARGLWRRRPQRLRGRSGRSRERTSPGGSRRLTARAASLARRGLVGSRARRAQISSPEIPRKRGAAEASAAM